jgi:hypothetical protein
MFALLLVGLFRLTTAICTNPLDGSADRMNDVWLDPQ